MREPDRNLEASQTTHIHPVVNCIGIVARIATETQHPMLAYPLSQGLLLATDKTSTG